jgi:DNA repair protein RecO
MGALVLQHKPQGESDRWLWLLDSEQGLLQVLAKGIRASRKRLAGCSEVFDSIQPHYVSQKNITLLQSAELKVSRASIAYSWNAYVRASRVVEMARKSAVGCLDSPFLFDAVERALNMLAEGRTEAAVQVYPALLRAAGVMPHPEECVRCLQTRVHMCALASGMGGFVCEACALNKTPLAYAVTQAMLGRVHVSDAAVADALEACACAWFSYHFDQSAGCVG